MERLRLRLLTTPHARRHDGHVGEANRVLWAGPSQAGRRNPLRVYFRGAGWRRVPPVPAGNRQLRRLASRQRQGAEIGQ